MPYHNVQDDDEVASSQRPTANGQQHSGHKDKDTGQCIESGCLTQPKTKQHTPRQSAKRKKK